MFFYMPTKVYQEKDVVINKSGEWCILGNRALIVTGRSSARANGSLADVIAALTSNKKEYVIFSEIEENPSVDTVMRARDMGISNKVDFVIGIGGGSPLDAAKAIALMIFHSDKDKDYLYTKGSDEALPVVAIPTTCGTGSEVTPYSILTRTELLAKGSIPHKVFPRYALVDSKYLGYAPVSVLHNTAVDALAHFYESYINTNATDYSRMMVEKGLKVWARSKGVLEGKREKTLDDLDNMMLASSMAGMAISMTGTSLPHGLSYPVTVRRGMPHGMGVGYFQAGYLREADKTDRDNVLKWSGFGDADELADFYSKVCTAEKLDEEILILSAEEILSNEMKLKNCPYIVDREKMLRIVGVN